MQKKEKIYSKEFSEWFKDHVSEYKFLPCTFYLNMFTN